MGVKPPSETELMIAEHVIDHFEDGGCHTREEKIAYLARAIAAYGEDMRLAGIIQRIKAEHRERGLPPMEWLE
jgi:hypothetical protein